MMHFKVILSCLLAHALVRRVVGGSSSSSSKMASDHHLIISGDLLGDDEFAFSEDSLDESRDSDEAYLFDLANDPYEDTNVYDDADYSTHKTLIAERVEYWITQLADADSPSYTDAYTTWASRGGVTAWLEEDDDYTKVEIEQKYFYSDAPNLVFIMVDDWGYNDVGFRSTWANWTTPNIDRLKSEGILLDNYYTHQICIPSRGAFLTGRYSLRLGNYNGGGAEVPLTEITIAQELKSAGYRTNLVGKWHCGMSTFSKYPTNRGFDYFYGYLNGLEDYYNKTFDGYVDVTENTTLQADLVDSSVHNAFILSSKVEEVITNHVADYSDKPLFLYYAMQLVHYPYTEAPDNYKARCTYPDSMDDDYRADVEYNYCAMQLLLDEAIGNVTCALEKAGLADNTYIVIAGDNGATSETYGSNYPFRGYKYTYNRGGVSNTAIIHSKLIQSSAQGTTYSGQVHVTDWLPTFMSLATDGEWTGSYTNATIDGSNIYKAAVAKTSSPHTEIVFKISSKSSGPTAIQVDMFKYMYKLTHYTTQSPKESFAYDLYPANDRTSCSLPSLVDYDDSSSLIKSTTDIEMYLNRVWVSSASISMIAVVIAVSSFLTVLAAYFVYVQQKQKRRRLDEDEENRGGEESSNKLISHVRESPRSSPRSPGTRLRLKIPPCGDDWRDNIPYASEF